MAKSIAKKSKREQVDTEDRIMETVATATMWAQRNRRAATIGLVALTAVVAAGVIYVRYKADLRERAAVRLDELRLTTQGATPELMREELGVFIAQFGGTPEASEARVFLAELELRRDSVDAAVRALEPVAALGNKSPLSYHAVGMVAAAQEQSGDTEAAMRSYRRLEDEALFDYQRRAARAAQARLHVFAGEYADAERIYRELVDDADAGADGAFYGIQLGEVLARSRAQLTPPSVPVIGLPESVSPVEGSASEPVTEPDVP